jgi:hypothetical protein
MADTSTVRIVFELLPDGFEHTVDFPTSSTVAAVISNVATELQLVENTLRLDYNGALLEGGDTLEQLGFSAGSTQRLTLTVLTSDSSNNNSNSNNDGNPNTGTTPGLENNMNMGAGEIEVVVHFDDPNEPPKVFQVRIEHAPSAANGKKYLGGYRSRKTQLEYHHATAQTDPLPQKNTGPERFTREAQTQEQTTRSTQNVREGGTQMARKDLHIDNSNDREIVARVYFTSQQNADLRLRKTIVMQCYWRGYQARCRAWSLRDAQEARRRAIADEQMRQKRLAEERHKVEVERRMNPRSFKDFEILYNELENWRLHETRRIKDASNGLSEAEQMTELAQLLDKETTLLQTIDRLKLTANKENRGKRIKKMLELMSEPKLWQMSDGDVAEVHTPFTTRAKELRELYNGLNLGMLSTDERLDVLLHVKWTVKEFDCNLTREIVDLIDREVRKWCWCWGWFYFFLWCFVSFCVGELVCLTFFFMFTFFFWYFPKQPQADLINRGRSEKSLVGLRRRLSNMFLQFIETPEFNPEAARFQKVPADVSARSSVRPLGADDNHGGH